MNPHMSGKDTSRTRSRRIWVEEGTWVFWPRLLTYSGQVHAHAPPRPLRFHAHALFRLLRSIRSPPSIPSIHPSLPTLTQLHIPGLLGVTLALVAFGALGWVSPR